MRRGVLTPLLVILLMNTTGEATVDASSVIDIVLQLLLPFVIGQLIRPLVIGLAQERRPHQAGGPRVDPAGGVLGVQRVHERAHLEHRHRWRRRPLWSRRAADCWPRSSASRRSRAKKLGFSLPDRIVIIFCGSKKSLATGLPMASVLFAGQPVGLIVLPLMIFHQIQLIVCAALAQRYAKRTDPESVTT